MWKAAVIVLLLFNVGMAVNGAADNPRQSATEKSRPEEKTQREETGVTSPANDNTSSFLGNLLVVPMDGSHWVGIKAIAQEMGRRGHRVTVVIPEVNMRMGPGKYYDTVTFPVPYDKNHIDSTVSTHKVLMQKSSQSFLVRIQKRFSQIMKITEFIHTTAESLLFNDSLISHLGQQVALLEPLFSTLLYWRFDQIAHQFLGEEVGVAEVLSDSDIWLLRTDLTLEHPRPLMPNMVQVGGINCNVRNPLPEVTAPTDLESWVSGEHGFVVFTLGSMVSDMPEETTVIFLEAFRQIPQKVIWRYTGQAPDNVPDNVKMMKWVPQNDLLAHSGARAFITHAGSHGLYEGLCHAVPMVMVPLGAEQNDNAERLVNKGAGVLLNIVSITTESLLQGLNEVLHDIRYKENVQKLSTLHRDRPVEPLDLSVYWTEYVMRHKGAKHLKSAGANLNWIQYSCLDIVALLAVVLLVVFILTVKCMKLC
ncbi:hypothetical protein INR49_000351, partial [Caranx melampygus]